MNRACHKNLPETCLRAKSLRESSSFIEKILWRTLRSKLGISDTRFRYQHPVSPYIVDFVCLSARLIIEIDGPSHDATFSRDEKRRQFLEKQGFQIMRFSNQDVLGDVDAVVATILQKADELQQLRWKDRTPPRNRKAISTLPQGEGDL